MEQPKSGANSTSCSEAKDLNLPISEEPIPRYHELPIEWVHARNVQVWAETCYDEAYFAKRLARMVDVPFVM